MKGLQKSTRLGVRIGGGAGATGGDNGDNAVFWENQLTVTHDYTITAARGAGVLVTSLSILVKQ